MSTGRRVVQVLLHGSNEHLRRDTMYRFARKAGNVAFRVPNRVPTGVLGAL
jgi:hypothetical protein